MTSLTLPKFLARTSDVDADQPEEPDVAPANATDQPAEELPAELPLLPLRGVVLYPMMYLPLTVGQPRSLRLIEDLIAHKQRKFALAASRDPDIEEPGPEHIYPIGTVAHIHRLVRVPDGTIRLIIHGSGRIHIDEFTAAEPYLRAKVSPHPDADLDSVAEQALASAAQDLFAQLVSLSPQIPDEMESAVRNVKNSRQLAYLIASSASLKLEDAQKILETDPLEEKLQALNGMLKAKIDVREYVVTPFQIAQVCNIHRTVVDLVYKLDEAMNVLARALDGIGYGGPRAHDERPVRALRQKQFRELEAQVNK